MDGWVNGYLWINYALISVTKLSSVLVLKRNSGSSQFLFPQSYLFASYSINIR